MENHFTAKTKFVERDGVRYAYRRFGADRGTPLLMLPHFRAGMDHWDPLVTNGLAAGRPVILFNNAGVASSTGKPADTMEAAADHVAKFLDALGVTVDLLGFSIGGYIAQSVVLRHAERVRRLVLVGTAPRGGEGGTDPRTGTVAANPVPTVEDFLFLFFTPSDASQAAGRAFWARRHERKDQDPPSSAAVLAAQRASIGEFRKPHGELFSELKSIRQPTLVVNGSNDIMVPTVNSFTLSQKIPNAQLILYPDSGHGALFQYPELFVKHVSIFLDS